MAEKRTPAKIESVEMVCEHCNKGLMVTVGQYPEVEGQPPQYHCVCDLCQHSEIYEKSYPYMDVTVDKPRLIITG